MSDFSNAMDYSLPDASIHGILQASILLPCPSPEDLPEPGIEPGCPALQADSLPSEPPGKPQIKLVYTLLLSYTFMSFMFICLIYQLPKV